MGFLLERGRRVSDALWVRRALIVFSSSSLCGQIVNMISGVIVLWWVEPDAMGLWLTAMLFRSWMDVLKIGVGNGMNRELPYLLGRQETALAEKVAASALALTLGTIGSGALIFAGASWFYHSSGDPRFSVGLLCAGLAWCITSYWSYLGGTFRSNSSFLKLGFAQYLDALLNLCTLPLVAKWGFYGLCARSVVTVSLSTGVLHLLRPIRVRPGLSAEAVRRIFSSGLPLFFASYAYGFSTGLDRLALLLFHNGTQLVGYYAPAVAVGTAMLAIPTTLLSYTYPRLTHAYGRNHSAREVWRQTIRSITFSLLLLLPVALTGVILTPWIIRTFFPRYSAGQTAMQIACATGMFFAFRMGTGIFATFKAWKWYWAYSGLLVAANAFGPLLFVTVLPPLEAVAVGMLASTLLSSAVMVYCGWRAYRETEDKPAVDLPEKRVEAQPFD